MGIKKCVVSHGEGVNSGKTNPSAVVSTVGLLEKVLGSIEKKISYINKRINLLQDAVAKKEINPQMEDYLENYYVYEQTKDKPYDIIFSGKNKFQKSARYLNSIRNKNPEQYSIITKTLSKLLDDSDLRKKFSGFNYNYEKKNNSYYQNIIKIISNFEGFRGSDKELDKYRISQIYERLKRDIHVQNNMPYKYKLIIEELSKGNYQSLETLKVIAYSQIIQIFPEK